MNRENIICMAREAGCSTFEFDTTVAHVEDLERFAVLVAEQAKAEEREACAKVCINLANRWTQMGAWGSNTEFHQCADDIRARGDKHD